MAIIRDIDGNSYNTAIIGGQEWIASNLKVTHYADGIPISNLSLDGAWAADADGAYCWYDNNISYKTPYGALYNWYAVNNVHKLVYFTQDGEIQSGWRIASDWDYFSLATYLGGPDVAGGKLKAVGTLYWASPNVGATDEVGFTAVGAGARSNLGVFNLLTYISFFWDSDDFGGGFAPFVIMLNNTPFIEGMLLADKTVGFSVRCVRDVSGTTTLAPTTTAIPVRGITISHNSPIRVTSTGLIPSVTFVVNPGVNGCYEFIDMVISATYKPFSVEVSLDRNFTDFALIPSDKIIEYDSGWYHIKRLPRTVMDKVLIGGSLFVKINYSNNSRFYDIKVVKTGYKQIIGG